MPDEHYFLSAVNGRTVRVFRASDNQKVYFDDGETGSSLSRVVGAEVLRLAEALGPDPSGRIFSELLRDAAKIINASGGGPIVSCLLEKAEALEAIGQ